MSHWQSFKPALLYRGLWVYDTPGGGGIIQRVPQGIRPDVYRARLDHKPIGDFPTLAAAMAAVERVAVGEAIKRLETT